MCIFMMHQADFELTYLNPTGDRLNLLPVDAQASILSFLGRHDLAHVIAVSRGCKGMATMERL
jgi:hypothetical protein